MFNKHVCIQGLQNSPPFDLENLVQTSEEGIISSMLDERLCPASQTLSNVDVTSVMGTYLVDSFLSRSRSFFTTSMSMAVLE